MNINPQFTIDEDIVEIENLEQEISVLERCNTVISNIGMTRSTVAMLCATNLLSSTALETMGMESLGSETYSGKDLDIAQEALGEKVKEKFSQWSAKVISTVKNISAKLTDGLKGIWDKISGAASSLASFSWEKTKEAGGYVKAHPFKTVLAVVTAALLVLGVAKFTAGSIPNIGAPVAALKSFMEKLRTMGSSIVSPFAKIFSKTAGNGVVTLAVENIEVAAPAAKSFSVLGWTKASFTSIYSKVTGLWNSVGTTIKPFWDKFVKPVEKVAADVVFFPKRVGKYVHGKTDSEMLKFGAETLVSKFYIPILIKVALNMFSLIKAFVVKAFNVIRDTFSALKNALV